MCYHITVNVTYGITCKEFLLQTLSGVTLWWLLYQMKSSQYARHTLHLQLGIYLYHVIHKSQYMTISTSFHMYI